MHLEMVEMVEFRAMKSACERRSADGQRAEGKGSRFGVLVAGAITDRQGKRPKHGLNYLGLGWECILFFVAIVQNLSFALPFCKGRTVAPMSPLYRVLIPPGEGL